MAMPGIAAVLMIAALLQGSAPTQKPPENPPPKQAYPQPKLYIDLNKIRAALDTPPTLNLDDQQLRYYVLVYGKQPQFLDFVGKFDLKNGPVPRAGMTHQEFLNYVTPKDYATPGGIKAIEALQVAVTNMAAQTIIRRGLEDLRHARTEREAQAIRDRINRELAALAGRK